MQGDFPTERPNQEQLAFPVTPSDYGDEIKELPLLLTVKEAAAVMRIGRDTTYSLVAQKLIPCVKLGKQIRIPRNALLAHLEREAQRAFDVDREAG